jgi:Ca-activated chloride channel family protein
MRSSIRPWLLAFALAVIVVPLKSAQGPAPPPPADPPIRGDERFRFKSGVELINVTATVSDQSGRFVGGLRKEDFTVYEDEQPVELTHFSADRVPVSLGILLDTSGSMAGEKMFEARSALNRFLFDLLDEGDEVFLYRFSNYPVLVSDWTTDRRSVARELDRIAPGGGTALFDTVSEAIPLAQQGRSQKKAIVIISDGNDTSSRRGLLDLKREIRESEVLAYAIGIDGEMNPSVRRNPPPRVPLPIPFPPRGRGRVPRGWPPVGGTGGGTSGGWSQGDERVNVGVLREMTDDSGGRTEIVRNARDLNPATVSIADELSQQYYLGYLSNGKTDGRWHTIRVEVKNQPYKVRARRGYVAS